MVRRFHVALDVREHRVVECYWYVLIHNIEAHLFLIISQAVKGPDSYWHFSYPFLYLTIISYFIRPLYCANTLGKQILLLIILQYLLR